MPKPDYVASQEAKDIRALTDKLHAVFIETGVTKSTAFAAMGVAISETYTDPEKLGGAIKRVALFAGFDVGDDFRVVIEDAEGTC